MCLISIEFSFVGKLWDGWETMKSPIIQDFKGRAGNFPGGEGELLWPFLSKLGSICKRVAFLSVWATISQVFLANWRAAHDTSWKCSWFKNTLFFVLYCFFFNKRTLPLLWEGHNWNYFYYLPTASKKQLLIRCKHLITDFFFFIVVSCTDNLSANLCNILKSAFTCVPSFVSSYCEKTCNKRC